MNLANISLFIVVCLAFHLNVLDAYSIMPENELTGIDNIPESSRNSDSGDVDVMSNEITMADLDKAEKHRQQMAYMFIKVLSEISKQKASQEKGKLGAFEDSRLAELGEPRALISRELMKTKKVGKVSPKNDANARHIFIGK